MYGEVISERVAALDIRSPIAIIIVIIVFTIIIIIIVFTLNVLGSWNCSGQPKM